jgi:hypothetical protein
MPSFLSMNSAQKSDYPDPSKAVLGFSKREKLWIPVFWSPEHQFWFMELGSGNVESFPPSDIIDWMDMPKAPKESVLIG